MKLGHDPAKNAETIALRGLPFDLAAIVLANLVVEYLDDRHDYGEVRMIAFGLVAGRLFNVVYTQRDDVVWVISLRKANVREQEKWL